MEIQPSEGLLDLPMEPYGSFLQGHTGRGSLKVQVSTARGTFPVPGAVVEVSREMGGERRVLYSKRTDSSGIAERMPLPARPAGDSRVEATAEGSGAQYQVSVFHPAFFPLRDATVEVYDGVETILPVALEPLVR